MQSFEPRWGKNSVQDVTLAEKGGFVSNVNFRQYALLTKVKGENAVRDAVLAEKGGFVSNVSDPSPLSSTQWRATPFESARARLAEYRQAYGPQMPEERLEHAKTIALELWALDNRQRPNGVWLDAACQVVGLDSNYLPEAQDAKF